MLRQNLLDEEFESLRRIALSICNTLGRPKDREICKSTLEVLARFNQAQSVTVKQNVHDFMVFYLKVLRWTYNNQPMGIYQAWVRTLSVHLPFMLFIKVFHSMARTMGLKLPLMQTDLHRRRFAPG